jgi:hypothetical protein
MSVRQLVTEARALLEAIKAVQYKDQIEVHGNAYPFRKELKALGFRWNPRTKTWSIPVSSFPRIQSEFYRLQYRT